MQRHQLDSHARQRRGGVGGSVAVLIVCKGGIWVQAVPSLVRLPLPRASQTPLLVVGDVSFWAYFVPQLPLISGSKNQPIKSY